MCGGGGGDSGGDVGVNGGSRVSGTNGCSFEVIETSSCTYHLQLVRNFNHCFIPRSTCT